MKGTDYLLIGGLALGAYLLYQSRQVQATTQPQVVVPFERKDSSLRGTSAETPKQPTSIPPLADNVMTSVSFNRSEVSSVPTSSKSYKADVVKVSAPQSLGTAILSAWKSGGLGAAQKVVKASGRT